MTHGLRHPIAHLLELGTSAYPLRIRRRLKILNALAALLPDFEHFSLGTKVTYGLPVSAQFVLTGFAYGACLIGLLLFLSGLLLQGREV